LFCGGVCDEACAVTIALHCASDHWECGGVTGISSACCSCRASPAPDQSGPPYLTWTWCHGSNGTSASVWQRVRSFARRRRTHAVSCPATIDLLGCRIERTAGLKIAAVIRAGLGRC